jgi:hypothetical protein
MHVFTFLSVYCDKRRSLGRYSSLADSSHGVLVCRYCRIRDSSVGIATGYGLDGRNSNTGRGKVLLSSGSGAHPASYPMGIGDSFSGVKEPCRETDLDITLICCWGKKWWTYNSTPPYVFLAWCLINYAQRQCYLYEYTAGTVKWGAQRQVFDCPRGAVTYLICPPPRAAGLEPTQPGRNASLPLSSACVRACCKY